MESALLMETTTPPKPRAGSGFDQARLRALSIDRAASRPQWLFELHRREELWRLNNKRPLSELKPEARLKMHPTSTVRARWEAAKIWNPQWIGPTPGDRWQHEEIYRLDQEPSSRSAPVLENSRPLRLFLFQVQQKVLELTRSHKYTSRDAQEARDLPSLAHEMIRASWVRQGIWFQPWTTLPGLHWKHEYETAYVLEHDQQSGVHGSNYGKYYRFLMYGPDARSYASGHGSDHGNGLIGMRLGESASAKRTLGLPSDGALESQERMSDSSSEDTEFDEDDVVSGSSLSRDESMSSDGDESARVAAEELGIGVGGECDAEQLLERAVYPGSLYTQRVSHGEQPVRRSTRLAKAERRARKMQRRLDCSRR